VETVERVINLLQEGNSTQSVAEYVGCSQSAGLKFGARTNKQKKGKVVKGQQTGSTREPVKESGQKTQSNMSENRKCSTKEMKNKWTETGVDVCERTVRNQLKDMGFPSREAKRHSINTLREEKKVTVS